MAVTPTNDNWQKYDNSWSGSFTDPNHWTGGLPGALTRAHIELSTDATITLPAGAVDTKASLRFNLKADGTITWDGSDAVFRPVACEEENYEDEPFGFRRDGTHFFNFQTYGDPAAVKNKRQLCVISNGVFRFTRASSPRNALRIDFDSGFYNFYDSDGTAYPQGWFHVGGSSCSSDLELVMHPGSHLRLPAVQMHNNTTGRSVTFAFAGGEHEIMGTLSMLGNAAYVSDHTATYLVVTNNASLYVGGTASFGTVAADAYQSFDGGKLNYPMFRTNYVHVADGGRLTFAGVVNNTYSGRLFVDVGDGGTLALGGNAATFGGTCATGTVVTVSRGGRLEQTASGGSLSIGNSATGSGHLVVDGGEVDLRTFSIGKANGADAVLVVTNGGTMAVSPAGGFYVGDATVDLSTGAAVTNEGVTVLGDTYPNSYMAVRDGATFVSGKEFSVGRDKGNVVLDVLGGDVRYDATMWVGKNAASTGTLNLVSGSITGTNTLNVGGNGVGTLNVMGGNLNIRTLGLPGTSNAAVGERAVVNVSGGLVKASDSISLGNGGHGEINVSGGEVDCPHIFLAQSADGHLHNVLLRLTGGIFRCRCVSDRQDVGVKMCDANVARESRVILDGGTLICNHVFGHTGARCRGGVGWAALAANGGTIQAPLASSAIICTLDEAKLGPLGLTVFSDYACGIPQDFADADDAPGQGLLRLAGGGVKTVTATNSTMGRLEVAQGTVKFAPNASGAQAALVGTSVSVAGGATLSLVGAQTSLTVKDLSLGDANGAATLAFDPGDVLYVTGTVSCVAATVLVTDGFAIGNDYSFIEMDGDHEAELADVWSRLRVRGAVADRGYSFGVEYDSASGKTRVKMRVFEASGEKTAVNWTGPGDAWGTGANWEGGAKPSATEFAAFASESAPNVVALGGPQAAMGVTFGSARGYALTDGLLSLSAIPGAEISATAGTNEIAVGLAYSRIGVDVAAGASLTVSGAASGDYLEKTGEGVFSLTNGANVLTDVVLSNGLLSVASPAATGGATITQKGGTLELGGTPGVETVYPQRFVLDNPAKTNALAIHTPYDVTVSSIGFSKGAPYKFGAGRLTVTASANTTIGQTEPVYRDWCYGYDGMIPLDVYGRPPDSAYIANFSVAEGELRLVGTAANADGVTFSARCYFAVGVPQRFTTVEPSLVVDHAKLDVKESGRHFILGTGFSDSNSNVGDVHLTLTNGASLYADTLYVGRQTTRNGMRWHVNADSATITSTYMLHANAAPAAPNALAEFALRNGSKLYTPTINAAGRANFLVDASELAKNANGDPLAVKYNQNMTGTARSGANYVFRNGSLFRCNLVEAYASAAEPTTLTFSNSEWDPCAAAWQFVCANAAKIKVYVEDAGLVLAPPAGSTWTFSHAVSGTGGLVKRGAGTVVFDTHRALVSDEVVDYAGQTTTVDFTGVASVEAGTLVVKAGAAKAGAKFAVAAGATLDFAGGLAGDVEVTGAGTVANGTFAGTVPVTVDGEGQTTSPLVTFAGDSLGFARVTVDLGRTAQNPLNPPFAPIVVARYTGAAPNVSSWRVANVGRGGVYGAFTAANGVITLQLKSGFSMIFR